MDDALKVKKKKKKTVLDGSVRAGCAAMFKPPAQEAHTDTGYNAQKSFIT